jgi:hypothetical protein
MEEAARIERRVMEAQTPKKSRPEPPVIHHGLTEQEKHERIIAFMSVPTNLKGSRPCDSPRPLQVIPSIRR